ncbi:MAG: YibE/F family protein [Spirochaetaceae bacterium]|nr:YibE/F family protein [Spirochaetaceae bacterium]
MNKNFSKLLSQFFTLAAAVFVFFFVSRNCVSLKKTLLAQQNGWVSCTGKIISVEDTKVVYYEDENTNLKQTLILFRVLLTGGKNRNKEVLALQTIDDFVAIKAKQVEAGDRVIVLNTGAPEDVTDFEQIIRNPAYFFEEYNRIPYLVVLFFIFAFLIILFGGGKGIKTLISLLLTCIVIFFYFIPSVFSGVSLYKSSLFVCLYSLITTILIISGYTKKSFIAIAGCSGGLLCAALLTVIMTKCLKLNGFLNNESVYLLSILPKGSSNLVSVIFASITIGSIGAIMDVSMSLASALNELAVTVPDISFKQLLKSGFEIGKDMMGTMANTLILAYIGGSLSFVLVLVAYNTSYLGLLNHQMITVEILQGLAGSIGILCTIPFTTILAAVIYSVKFSVSIEK